MQVLILICFGQVTVNASIVYASEILKRSGMTSLLPDGVAANIMGGGSCKLRIKLIRQFNRDRCINGLVLCFFLK